MIKIFFIGDIVGKPGREICCELIRDYRRANGIDLVIANGENAADGVGIMPAHYHELVSGGIDCITLGDHAFRRKEIFSVFTESLSKIVRPANYPKVAPGRSSIVLSLRSGIKVGIFCCLGRVFMDPVDCPFTAANRVLEEFPEDVKVRIVDFHAEATSDKQLMGRHLDGKVSAVFGTHTHVATADEAVLPGGTAYISDVGMTGPHHSIIGRRIDRVLEKVRTFRPTHFDVATEDVRISGAVATIDETTGLATSMERVQLCSDENP